MYDWREWAFTREDYERPDNLPPGWAEEGWQVYMDRRHTEFLYELALRGGFQQVLEIGCFNGSSTSALIQALLDGASFELHLCDIIIRPLVREVVNRLNPGRRSKVVFHEQPSVEVISMPYDFIMVDGDHALETVAQEVDLLVGCMIPTVCAHDTANPYEKCDGARYLAQVYKCGGWYWREDTQMRSGECTDRGFLFATTRLPLFRDMASYWEAIMNREGYQAK